MSMPMRMTSLLSSPFTRTSFHLPTYSSISISKRSSSSSPSTSTFHPTNATRLLHFTPIKRDFRKSLIVKCSVQPPPSSPLNPSGNGFGKGWLVGIVLAILLPFLKDKWGPLLLLKKEVDTVIEMAEDTVEVLEKVADEVEKVVEDVVEELPEGQVKVAATLVENVAKEAAKDAHLADAVLHEVQEMEEKVETLIKSNSSSEASKDK